MSNFLERIGLYPLSSIFFFGGTFSVLLMTIFSYKISICVLVLGRFCFAGSMRMICSSMIGEADPKCKCCSTSS